MKIEQRVYAELGYGNDTFLNTEIENWEDGEEKSEFRIPKFILPEKIDEFYLRFWIGKRTYAFSTRRFVFKKKDKNKIKILFGIGGSGYKKK